MKTNKFASLMALSMIILVGAAGSQSAPLPIGTLSNVTPVHQCPSGFWPGPQGGTQTVCYQATIGTGVCPNTYAINVIFGYVAPKNPLGTIALLSGFGGTRAYTPEGDETVTASDYYGKGYAVVQSQWSYDWEDTNGPLPEPVYPYNILTAACRPATLLNHINKNIKPAGVMCAQGESAGAGAIAYSLVWYGAGAYLKATEMLSGPELADLQMGCQVPPALNGQPVSLCSAGQNASPYCSPGTKTEVGVSAWNSCPQFVYADTAAVQGWTGNLGFATGATCNNANNGSTNCNLNSGNDTTTENPSWKAQSILTGNGGSFSYTALNGMEGWLCYSSSNCTPQTACPNNSAAQGWQYYNQLIGVGTKPNDFLIVGVKSCDKAENVNPGTDPDNNIVGGAQQAIENDMVSSCHL